MYVADVDAVEAKAKASAAGAKIVRPAADQFYGDRSGTLQDPFGHRWFVSTRKKELASAEIKRRYDEMVNKAE